VIATVKE